MEKFTQKDLENVLDIMKSYINDSNAEERNIYLQELAKTALWHNAIGKVIENDNESINVLTEY